MKVMSVVKRVKAERQRRGWSQRAAAEAGGVSNQTWSNFEVSGIVTDKMRSAVVAAYGWPVDWPEELPPDDATPNSVAAALAELRARVEALESELGIDPAGP
jgi:transcriptional regulator with XRE-family HTH domain